MGSKVGLILHCCFGIIYYPTAFYKDMFLFIISNGFTKQFAFKIGVTVKGTSLNNVTVMWLIDCFVHLKRVSAITMRGLFLLIANYIIRSIKTKTLAALVWNCKALLQTLLYQAKTLGYPSICHPLTSVSRRPGVKFINCKMATVTREFNSSRGNFFPTNY